jgi:geranylgeranyl diphosphate synthase type II
MHRHLSSLWGSIEQALPSAVSIELLHNAFVVHDDIEAGLYRRNRATLYVEQGSAA